MHVFNSNNISTDQRYPSEYKKNLLAGIHNWELDFKNGISQTEKYEYIATYRDEIIDMINNDEYCKMFNLFKKHDIVPSNIEWVEDEIDHNPFSNTPMPHNIPRKLMVIDKLSYY